MTTFTSMETQLNGMGRQAEEHKEQQAKERRNVAIKARTYAEKIGQPEAEEEILMALGLVEDEA